MHLFKTLFTLLLTFGCLASFFGCASILSGTSQEVTITSSPQPAQIEIKNMGGMVVFTGATPAVAKLRREYEYNVHISLDGYQQTMVHISQEFNAIYLGNIICGGIIGLIVDASNGAMYNLEPEMINVTLVTASIDGNSTQMYAVLRTIDASGQLQTLVVPLIRNT
jgi:hypothetical protein